MNRKRLAWLSFVLILLVLTGCTGGSGGISVRSELRSRVSQYEKTWNNLDRNGIKSFYAADFAAYYADQEESIQDLMDELGISVLTYDEMLFLIDFSVDYYTALRDLGVHSTFKYEDFRLINYSDNTINQPYTSCDHV